MNNKPKISYAITVCSELKELENLLDSLGNKIPNNTESEIVILCDTLNGNVSGVVDIYNRFLDTFNPVYDHILEVKPFEKDFADHKNYLNALCEGEWILQLDADEDVTQELIYYLDEIIKSPDEFDIIGIPRVNIVNGLTARWADIWHWNLKVDKSTECLGQYDMLGAEAFKLLDSMDAIVDTNDMASCGGFIYNPILVNFPDYQLRFYRNSPEISWQGKVHEKINGGKICLIPESVVYCLKHIKSIDKQVQQNKLYENIANDL